MNLHPSARALVGGLVWAVMGAFLVWRGLPYWQAIESSLWRILVPVLALLIGAGKGWFVLRKSAQRMINRIKAEPGPRPFWQIYPPYLYLLIPVMIGFGVGVRYLFGASQPGIVAGVYLGIGAALVTSSIPFFKAWRTL